MDLVGRWWVEYDEGNVDVWPDLFTADARFTCRTDTGQTAYEEFVRADISGRDDLLRWQTAHRRTSPYPLRHNAANIHVTGRSAASASFRSYIVVTHIVDGKVTPLSTAVVSGAVRRDGDDLALSELHVVLDTKTSVVFSER